MKAESDVPGRREIHARNGNLFNESLLFRSGVDLPLEHPAVYTAIIDEDALDYLIVMEDLVARGADPRDPTRPFTADEVAWLRYRASSAHGLTVWLMTLPSDVHAPERSLALVRRYATAFDELDTPAAVSDLLN